MAKRKRAGKSKRKPTRAPVAPRVITIRALINGDAENAAILANAPLARVAEEWTYILRSRARWADDDELRVSHRKRALEDLARLGVKLEFVKKLAAAMHIEVELHPWDAEDREANFIHEAAAEMPWEYLFSAATRGVGRHAPLLVTRLLRNHTEGVNPPPPKTVLFVESAPGRLEGSYEFEQERTRLAAAIDARIEDDTAPPPAAKSARAKMFVSHTEDLARIKTRAQSTEWDVVHITGVDTHQAGWLVEDFYDDLKENSRPHWNAIVDKLERITDGMILRERNVPELPVSYRNLAKTVINRKTPPSLVTLNLYYSGARIAREMVAMGAHVALGFLDEIDDELAERFFQAFYWEWCRPNGAIAIPHAIAKAWAKMSSQRLHGTGIVVWMGTSVFDKVRWPRPEALAPVPADTRLDQLARHAQTPIGELLQVQVELPDGNAVNYSLLHNDRPLLTRLTLTKLVAERLEDITVQVELNLGSQNYPYRCTHMVLDEPQRELSQDVRIPLTATLPRSLRERVQSTVYVKVTCGGRTAWESTERITLIPVDEWLDDTVNNPWLPSFVLPRDPAVRKIISSSRRYLIGIADDPAAGFSGYQAVDEDGDTTGVDAQVRAIWTALVNEERLLYINPPPSYSEQSQRLRTPSEILSSNSGTCIDLALLLASCLEYVDIYPVVVLLTGHAFVGYWRSEESHDAFVEVLHVPVEVPPAGSPVARSANVRLVEEYGWRLTRLHYDEIMEYVNSGDLVMLEATYLTAAWSFADAIVEGRANMRSRRQFDSLLDIRLARSATPPVTPLPIINE